ncbi:hypothetical protein Poli38472_010796 [Pythium oligandrum]|uniref:Uncharacterized protein n=1 Tax=Pythium oligandrum TaxID=41045 RepID=A0A8K1CFS2_PYTOL|nr:hypothetical protein Poli38472_010796 [Pythium oligandrum]|eukprot:TMW61733.1 hypothetical protein Poli38472_010796 [Pythium oligandrum]
MTERGDLKPLLRLLSAVVGLCLLVLSCAGFHHLGNTTGTLEGQASFGCMCFLGVIFGALLFFGELRVGLFFFFFGFMRYRVGRAIVFTVAGIMVAIMGKTMDDQCRCKKYVLLIIQGVACLACAALQLIGVFTFGNNTTLKAACATPPPAAAPPAAETTYYVPPTPQKTAKKAKSPQMDTNELRSVQAVPSPSPSSPPPSSRGDDESSNMPSWMKV